MPCRSLLKFLIPATILLGASPSLAESRLALVIGQSAYKSVPALPNPANCLARRKSRRRSRTRSSVSASPSTR